MAIYRIVLGTNEAHAVRIQNGAAFTIASAFGTNALRTLRAGLSGKAFAGYQPKRTPASDQWAALVLSTR